MQRYQKSYLKNNIYLYPIEYRVVKPYCVKKLVGRDYDKIIFKAGYRTGAPRYECDYKGYLIENIKHEFLRNEEITVFSLPL